MLYLFIAVIAVLLIMNVFMLFVLKQMAGAAGRQIERDAGRLFGIYDEMLEEKSLLLEVLESEEEKLRERLENPAFLGKAAGKKREFLPSAPMRKADFRDRDFARNYNRVKEVFSMEKEAFARAFLENLPAETAAERSRRECLEQMRDILNFDNLYKISILDTEQQMMLLEQIFTKEQALIYEQWKNAGQGSTVTDFSDWLDYQLMDARRTIVIKTAKAPEQRDPQIQWEEDSSVCEGIKIIYRGSLYDYSL